MWLLLLLAWPLTGQAAAPHALQEARYRIEVTYEATGQTLQGHAILEVTWHGTQPLTELYLFLPPNTLGRRDPREAAAYSDLRYARGFDPASLTVHHVTTAARQPLRFQIEDDPHVPVGRVPDGGLLRVILPRPYAPGERLQVTVEFTTRVPEARNWGVYDGILALDGLWYPMLVPYRQGRWIRGLQEFVHADYTLTLHTDAAQQAVASVPWSQHSAQADQQTLSGSATSLYHLGLSSSATWHSEHDTSHTPVLRLLAPPGEAPRAAHLLRTLQTAVTFFHQRFGLTLSAAAFTVVVHERDQSWPFSAVADHMIFLSRDVVRVPSLVQKLAEYFLVRGVAQQWWGLHTAYNLNIERWIGEGLSTYLTLLWLDHQYGRGRNFLTWRGSWLPNFSYREQNVEVPYRRLAVNNRDQLIRTPLHATDDNLGLRFVREKKGALIYSMLHDLLGADAFRAFLQRLQAGAQGTIVTTADVHRAAEAASDTDLDWFFRQWVEQRVQLDYAVGRIEAVPQTDAAGQTVYVNRVEVRRLGEAVMPLAVRLFATDGTTHDVQLAGTAERDTITWQYTAPVSDVHIDPQRRLPDVQPLNNTAHFSYAVRPLIDFPRLDRYLIYPFLTLENNFIDGYTPRLHLYAQYLDDQLASISAGYKETPQEVSIEGLIERRRFPHPDMTSRLSFTDRMSARTLSLETSLLIEESHHQQLIPANIFTVGYRVAFLERLEEFNGEPVPAGFAPSTGRIHSVVLQYERDTRVPAVGGAPPEIIPEPLVFGYALRLQVELASEVLGSTEPDFQQIRWEASEFLRLGNQTWLQLRLFGGWSAGTIPLQRKLSLAGIDTLRGYPYRLRFLGDRMLGGTLAVRFPLLRDVRIEDPQRFFSLRSLHLSPFVDGGWIWDRDEALADVSLRSSAGLRLILGLGFVSLLRFEVSIDIAHPLDKYGRDETEGPQVWIRFHSTARGGLH